RPRFAGLRAPASQLGTLVVRAARGGAVPAILLSVARRSPIARQAAEAGSPRLSLRRGARERPIPTPDAWRASDSTQPCARLATAARAVPLAALRGRLAAWLRSPLARECHDVSRGSRCRLRGPRAEAQRPCACAGNWRAACYRKQIGGTRSSARSAYDAGADLRGRRRQPPRSGGRSLLPAQAQGRCASARGPRSRQREPTRYRSRGVTIACRACSGSGADLCFGKSTQTTFAAPCAYTVCGSSVRSMSMWVSKLERPISPTYWRASTVP